MRVLRTTIYSTLGPPITSVVRDSDTMDSLEGQRQTSLEDFREESILFVFDLFSMDDGNLEAASVHALRRMDEEREANMAVLYFWALRYFPNLNDGGLFTTERPAPLSEGEVRTVLSQLVTHPNYHNFFISVEAEDGTVVRAQGGEVL